MSKFLPGILDLLARRRTARARWGERWADPEFYGTFQLDELAHYSILAGYMKALKPGGSMLDVGCGNGVLREHLHSDAFSRYVGVDFPEAIGRAAPRMDDRTSFTAADMREFEPTHRFDVIFFNESLYYVDAPINELRRYAGFLEPEGIFLVSMHRKVRSEKIWDAIGSSGFLMIDRVEVSNRAGVGWIVGAFRPA